MQIGIIGLGLIGGSLGLDLRSHGHYVWGLSRSQSTCEEAKSVGAVDEAGVNLTEIKSLDQTEVIFVCTPIDSIIKTIAAIAPQLKSSVIITDVGSVKSAVIDQAQTLHPRFIGGHPMAGTAFSGISAAQKNLFQGRPCVLTPNQTTDQEALKILRSLWQSVGAVMYECDPEAHDRSVAWISHLPILISAGLILACDQESNQAIAQLAQHLASSGFRDTSRVGGGNPQLGSLIAEYNQVALLDSLKAYQRVLADLIHQIEAKNWRSLEQSLTVAQQLRNLYL
ncbi:prephenate dehydrogenase [Synechococcus sp. PCC 7502]|uniref:prephenate/arogenate dehydrogenase n=1 Tax=Synechococcus sp. PCC 7502 TaxID=1173263 RepID=UPI00029FED07|nr:prephenate/arogenate dehydrogenase [Synechococcus sp. PCC 7502]AFY72271.1 prephenate dehydrogenase [Synechococcus sp. PCC 7502]